MTVKPLPAWMTDRTQTPASADRPAGNRRPDLLYRALSSFARLLGDMVADDAIADRDGLLQRVSPRAKTTGLIVLIITATLVHNVSTLLLAYLFCLLLAILSGIPRRRLWRTWLTVPLFSAAIMLPALFNIVTPGRPLATLWHFKTDHFGPLALPSALTITDAGLYVAGRFVLRTVVCVTLALLLTASTRSDRLLRGLRGLGVPVLFVMLLGMMQRYLTLLLRAAEEIHLARISRSIRGGSLKQEQAWVTAGMGSLYRRTRSLSQSVHLAMISRGYGGEVRLLDEPGWKPEDWGFIMITTGLTITLLAAG